MKALDQLPHHKTKYLFCDIDDTMTTEGQLLPEAYESLWQLHRAGIEVIPVTGRPAGWCELIARLWPVKAVIGENGAFYFSYCRKSKKMSRHFTLDKMEMDSRLSKVTKLANDVLGKFPGTAIASDQFCRLVDVAVDFCEDVPALSLQIAEEIKDYFVDSGATAKVSSIHVNAWFGNHDKLSMCKTFCEKELNQGMESLQSEICFIGDSPNDEPMFEAFGQSVGVANVLDFKDRFTHLPKYICSKKSGDGFTELCKHLISKKQQ